MEEVLELPLATDSLPYFSGRNFSLFEGDSTDIMGNLLPESFDLIFADPPYFLSNGGSSVRSGRRVSVNKGAWDSSSGVEIDFAFHMRWIEAAKKLLKPNGTLWISGTYHSIYQCGFALQRQGFKILNEITWFKPNASPNLSCRCFTASHETLIWARKNDKAKHYFNYDLMKNGEWAGDIIKKPGLQMRSVWSINPPKPCEKTFGKHPTQKPIELLRRIVLASTEKNARILDPFCGSGTTGIATMLVGGKRQFTGIDICQNYLDLTIKRYDQFMKEREMFDGK